MRLGREARHHLEALERLDGLVAAKRFEEAKGLLFAARDALRAAGLGHGWVSWQLASFFDSAGAWERAFELADEALAQDPLSLPFHEALASMTKRARTAFLDSKRDPAEPTAPVLYRLLVDHGGATEEVHLAMARWRLGRGDVSGAHGLAVAVTVLAPLSAEGWACRAEAARRRGAEEEASACEFEAGACASRAPAPFAVPGEARA